MLAQSCQVPFTKILENGSCLKLAPDEPKFYGRVKTGKMIVEGNNLYIDVVWIGRSDCDKLYMSTSGIHGVEGFAGSAIQFSILDNLNNLPDKTALAFIHILNPWGMSWLRRENELNVDLNRNFLKQDEEYSGSHPHYSKLDPLINIKYPAKQNDFFSIKFG